MCLGLDINAFAFIRYETEEMANLALLAEVSSFIRAWGTNFPLANRDRNGSEFMGKNSMSRREKYRRDHKLSGYLLGSQSTGNQSYPSECYRARGSQHNSPISIGLTILVLVPSCRAGSTIFQQHSHG